MVQLLLISALLLSVPAFCTGQGPLNVSFQMNGVTGSAILTWQAFNLTATITLSESLGAGPVNVEIRPIWVDYDVDDKCSTAQLGAAIPGWTASVTFTTSTAVVSFPNVESLDSLEGYSILLYGSSKAVCASIESRQEHATAFAQFQNLVQGYVYFRQSMSNYTRIVTDLFSEQGSYNSSWFISNTFNSCSLITPGVQLKEFNPSNANGVNCSKTSQASCAAGQLSDKLGNVTIGGNKREARLGYTDKSLSSISDINGKLLLIKTSNGSFACAVIKAFSGHKALVEFSHEGVTGSVMFSQSSPLDPTTTVINITGLNNMASGYHVHVWPTPTKITDGQDLCGGIIVSGHYNPYNKIVTSPSYPSPDNSTDDMYELGDLSSKYGTMAQKTNMINTYTDYNLPLYGQNSIIGRSFVIHHNDSAGSRWICANIEPYSYPVVAAIAVFEFPVIGQIIFVQGQDQLETSIFAKLDYIDGRPGTTKNRWGINTNTVTNDMLSTTETSRCLSTGAVYNPHNVGQQMNQYTDYCSKNSPLGCKLGDMSGKLGILSIRNAANSDTSARQFFTDTNLPLFGPYSVIGRSVVIFNEMGTSILACANIKMLRDPLLTASFSMGGVSGTVSFSQTAGYGAKKTMVTNKLNGLQDKYRLFVYDLPPASGNTICSDLGNVFNPLNITQNASTTDTDDKFMVGDLSSNGIQTSWNRYNLPLTGLTSINKRSLVVVDQDSQNKVVSCARIDTVGSGENMEAVSTFTGDVNGTVHLYQTVYEDGAMSDTSILVDLTNQDGHKSLRHNWHTHIDSIQGDANASPPLTCSSAKGHYDPFMAMNNKTNYASECSPGNPLRCEMGDQSSKTITYDIGGGRKLVTDVDLALAGTFSILGRSIVFHIQDKGDPRLACADIIPVTSVTETVEIKSATIINRQDVAIVYAKAIMTDPSNVVVELISELNGITKLQVHFLGFQKTALKNKFTDILNKNKSSLDPYIPYANSANYSIVSTFLLMVVTAVQLLNYL